MSALAFVILPAKLYNDIAKEKTAGETWDLGWYTSMGTADLYAGDYSDCADCDLIVSTAGRNRSNGD